MLSLHVDGTKPDRNLCKGLVGSATWRPLDQASQQPCDCGVSESRLRMQTDQWFPSVAWV